MVGSFFRAMLLLGAGLGASLSAPLAIGGWNSGGELIRDGLNPWFVQNTPIVQACYEIDAENFHLPADKNDLLNDYIQPALDYWDEQLQDGESVDSKHPVVGTQTFVFGPCTEATQLRFQFGKLSAAQLDGFKQYGRDPHDFVSIALRTDYDSVNLRGRGVIYIAPDSGPLRPNAPHMLPRPWATTRGIALRAVLAHELGHVFGLPHTQNPVIADLMNARTPEHVVSDGWELYDPLPNFFVVAKRQLGNSICIAQPTPSQPPVDTKPAKAAAPLLAPSELRTLPLRTINFLGLPPDSVCLFFAKDGQRLDVYAAPLSRDYEPLQFVKIGSAELNLPAALHDNVFMSRTISFWFPPTQQVFPHDYDGETIGIGPPRQSYRQSAVYRSFDGKVRSQLGVQIAPGVVTAFGVDQTMEFFSFWQEGVYSYIGPRVLAAPDGL